MSVPLIRDPDRKPYPTVSVASFSLFLLWVSVPAVATYFSATYFMALGYTGYEAQAAPSAALSYGALALLVAITGVAGRQGDLLLDIRALIIGAELVFAAVGALVVLPAMTLDRHPFLPADAPLLPPLSALEVARIWISAVLAMYAIAIAFALTVLQPVARTKGWPEPRERKVIYVTFGGLIGFGTLSVALLYLLRG